MSKRIIAQDETVLVGVDVHTRSHVVTVKVGKEIRERCTLSPRADAWRSYLKRFPGCELHIVYESGPHGYTLHDSLGAMNGVNGQAIHVYIAPPANVPKAPGKKRVKTDTRDSLALIQAFECGSFAPVVVPDKAARAERELTRAKEQMTREATRLKNRVHAMIKFHGIDYPEAKIWSEAWEKELLAGAGAVDPAGTISYVFQLKLKLLKDIQQTIAGIKNRIKSLYKSGARSRIAKSLQKHTGIGIESAMAIAAEVANFHAFRNSDAFASYTGLVPSAHNSGETEHSGPITKEGNRRLRRIFVECAWTWVRFDPDAARRFAALKIRRGARRAIVAMARRMAVRVYHIAVALPEAAA